MCQNTISTMLYLAFQTQSFLFESFQSSLGNIVQLTGESLFFTSFLFFSPLVSPLPIDTFPPCGIRALNTLNT